MTLSGLQKLESMEILNDTPNESHLIETVTGSMVIWHLQETAVAGVEARATADLLDHAC